MKNNKKGIKMIKNIIFDIGGVIVDYKFGDYVERLGLDKRIKKEYNIVC